MDKDNVIFIFYSIFALLKQNKYERKEKETIQ